MENNAKKDNKKTIEKMKTKFEELSTKIEQTGRQRQQKHQANEIRITSATLQVSQQLFKKNQQNRQRNYLGLSRTLKTKLTEILETYYFHNRYKKRIIKRKHGITIHMCSPVVFVDFLNGFQISFLVTLKEHTEVIPKTLIHLFM